MGCKVLIFNLILHILFRGFWIGAIGLSSVKNKQDFSKLRYTEKFTTHLSQKVPSLEKLIIHLDDFCSTIFAFTFLIVLMLISCFSFILVFLLIFVILSKIENWLFGESFEEVRIFSFVTLLIFSLSGLFYFLDTLTLGGLKNKVVTRSLLSTLSIF